MNKQEETIKTCILIAQSFANDLPCNPALADFNSAPAMDFTISWLISNRIKQCIVMYSKSKAQIQEFFNNNTTKDIKITLVYVKQSQCKSPGDFLRQANFRQLVSNDFLLVHGDVITNLCLKDLIEDHLRRKHQSKINILTVALGLSNSKEHLFVLDDTNGEIIQMHDLNKPFELDTERCKLKRICEYSLRCDLSSARVYACSIEVLKSFKETFEFQNMNDFINGMLTSQIYQEKIFSYVLKNNQFSSKIAFAAQYYDAYMNLISRYLYPFTVKSHTFAKSKHKPFLKYMDYNKYVKSDCDLSKVKLSHGVYVGEGAKVGARTNLFKSILNRNCEIGENCTLRYCIVTQGTVVPANSDQQQQLEIKSFKHAIIPERGILVAQQLFPETPAEEQTFEEELKILISETPTAETFEELSSLRKMFNRQPKQLVAESISMLNPSTVKEVEKCVKQWGGLFKKTCAGEPSVLIDSFILGGQKNTNVKKAFHIYLQYLYGFDHLSKSDILEWYDGNHAEHLKPYTDLCRAFCEKLKQESSDEEDDDYEDDE